MSGFLFAQNVGHNPEDGVRQVSGVCVIIVVFVCEDIVAPENEPAPAKVLKFVRGRIQVGAHHLAPEMLVYKVVPSLFDKWHQVRSELIASQINHRRVLIWDVQQIINLRDVHLRLRVEINPVVHMTLPVGMSVRPDDQVVPVAEKFSAIGERGRVRE